MSTENDLRLTQLLAALWADPTIARGLRVAPAQTIRSLRALSASDRRGLLAIARRAPTDVPRPIHPMILSAGLHVYLASHSIQSGEALTAHAAVVPMNGATVDANNNPLPGVKCSWRVFPVTEYSDPTLGPKDNPPVKTGTGLELPLVDGGPFNGDEVGYDWPPATDVNKEAIVGPSGLYALVLNSDQGSTYALFVLRAPSANGRVLFCWPFATLFVYAGRESVYESVYETGHSKRLRRVALRRPLDHFGRDKRPWCITYPLALWTFIMKTGTLLKDIGGAVDHCMSFDLHNPALLSQYRLLVSAGHDEYWTKAMRDNVESFIAQGGNVAFFNGNTCWSQIRLEPEQAPTQIACYKSGVEDPSARTHPETTTTLWSSSPAARPECALTGLSFRDGSQTGMTTLDQYTVHAPAHWAMAGVTNGAFPSTPNPMFAGLENDGVALRNGTPVRVPSTFTLIALMDNSARAANPDGANTMAGSAAVGCYTNNGTVFSAGAIGWPVCLADSDVATITANVLRKLASAPPTGVWATFPVVENPAAVSTDDDAYGWEQLDTNTRAAGIAATMRGTLYRVSPDGTVDGLNADNPRTSSWTPTVMTVPVWSPNALRICNNMFGTRLFIATERRQVFGDRSYTIPQLHTFNTVDGKAVGDPTDLPPQACAGLAPHFTTYYNAFIDPSGHQWLRVGGVTIGPWLHRALTGDAWEGKLYAATSEGALVCREAMVGNNELAVDMVWRKIGRVPTDTFALAAGGGRIFALSGSPQAAGLSWRLALADPVYRDPVVVFARSGRQGGVREVDVWRVCANGDLSRLGTWANVPDFDYDLAVRVSDTDVFFLSQNGMGKLLRFFSDKQPAVLASWTQGSFVPGPGRWWTHLAYAHNGINAHVIFYEQFSGQGVVGHFGLPQATGAGHALVATLRASNPPPMFIKTWGPHFVGNGWEQVVAANAAPDGGYVLFRGSGRYAVGRISVMGEYVPHVDCNGMLGNWTQLVPAGQTYVLCYDEKAHDLQLVEYVSADGGNPAGVVRSVWSDRLRVDKGDPSNPIRRLCGVEHGLIVSSHTRLNEAMRCETIGVRDVGGSQAYVVLRAADTDSSLAVVPAAIPYCDISVGLGGVL